ARSTPRPGNCAPNSRRGHRRTPRTLGSPDTGDANRSRAAVSPQEWGGPSAESLSGSPARRRRDRAANGLPYERAIREQLPGYSVSTQYFSVGAVDERVHVSETGLSFVTLGLGWDPADRARWTH